MRKKLFFTFSIILFLAIIAYLVFMNINLKKEYHNYLVKHLDTEKNNIITIDSNLKPKTLKINDLDIVLKISDQHLPDQIFDRPCFITVDPKHNIYISENRESKIRTFQHDGSFIKNIGHKGKGPGEFWGAPFLRIIDSTLFILDSRMNRLNYFSSKGIFINSFDFIPQIKINTPNFAMINKDQFAVSYFDHESGTLMHIYNSMGHKVFSFGKIIDQLDLTPTTEHVISNFGHGFLQVHNNTIYLSRFYPYEISVFSLDGKILKQIRRNDNFLSPPVIEVNGESTRYHAPSTISFFQVTDKYIFQAMSLMGEENGYMLDILNHAGIIENNIIFSEPIEIRYISEDSYVYATFESEFGYEILKFSLDSLL